MIKFIHIHANLLFPYLTFCHKSLPKKNCWKFISPFLKPEAFFSRSCHPPCDKWSSYYITWSDLFQRRFPGRCSSTRNIWSLYCFICGGLFQRRYFWRCSSSCDWYLDYVTWSDLFQRRFPGRCSSTRNIWSVYRHWNWIDYFHVYSWSQQEESGE